MNVGQSLDGILNKEVILMNTEEIMRKLQDIFIDVFNDKDIYITEKTNAEDIEAWDSLKNISILAAVQDEFSVSFEIDEIVAMKNVGDIINAILGKL